MATGNWQVENARAVIWLPTHLEHADGSRFEFDLGTLKAKEYRRIQVAARAVLSGQAVVRADVTWSNEQVSNIEIRTIVE